MKMASSPDRSSVSIYLIKASRVSDFERDIGSDRDTHALAQNLEGYLVTLPSPPKEPVWLSSVRTVLATPSAASISTQAAGGIVVVRRQARTFAVCFGTGWMRLKPEWLEHDFGRRVALNAISKDSLIEVNAEQVFAKWHFATERAPRATSLREFGVESERDLVSAVEGVPKDSALLGPVLRGGTSVRVKIPFSSIGPVLDKLLSLFKSNALKKTWPELHNLMPVVDGDLISELDGKLDSELKAWRGRSAVILTSPVLRRENVRLVDAYVFGRNTKGTATAPYLMFGSWESHLTKLGATPSVQLARETPVHFLDEVREHIGMSSVYETFGYETSYRGRQYVLSSGVWYEAGADFVAEIGRRIAGLRKPPVLLPKWDGVSSEGDFNRMCAAKSVGMLHFDAKNVLFGGGQSKFELCDLMHYDSKTMFFAKIANKSADLSHLSEQVRRTVELLFSQDGGFRAAVKKMMIKHHPKADASWLDGRPRPGDWNLCLVSLGRPATDLPFFAKCGLARLLREMEAVGHSVHFQHV